MIRIKVAVVDSQELIRAALHGLLLQEETWELGTRIEVVTLVGGQAGADVVLVGTDSGLEALEPFRPVATIAYGRGDAFFACRALAAGARAYVSTSIEAKELLRIIAAVARGERPTSPEVEQALVGGGPAANLTEREFQTLELLAKGLTNREIAGQMDISVKTVDTHRGHLINKLGLRNNSDLTRFAIKHGIVPLL